MEGPPLGPGGEDITWPDQVAPRGRKASTTRKIKPQTLNLYIRRGLRANVGIFLGMDLRSISRMYITFRFDTCMEHLNICRMHF